MYKKQKLKNGLRLITAPLKDTKAVTVLILLPVGSRYEVEKNNGVSHFIEHLMFKGTEKRPTSLDLTKELDAIGAEYNAFTSKDHTGYYIKASADNLELAFDILSDMIFNSTLKPEEIEKERGVIVEEINMYEDNPMMFIQTIFEETLFEESPLGRWISGPREIIKKISRQEIIKYRDNHYYPANMVVTVAGKFSEKKVKNLAEKYFGKSRLKKHKPNFEPFSSKQNGPRVKINYKETEQVQLCLGVPAFALDDPKMYPLYLLAVILGGNMSSRLFASVREEKGLAYYIRTDISHYQDTGNFLVQAGLDKNRIQEAIILILSELKKTALQGVTPKELLSAKNFLKGKLILDLEDCESFADWFGKQELLSKKILKPEDKIKKIFDVKLEQVKQVAEELFKSQKLNLALIGPFKDKDKFKSLLKF